MDKTIQILTSPMGCEPSARRSLIASAILAIKNGTTEAFEKQLTSSTIQAKVYAMDDEDGEVDTVDPYELDDVSIPTNSVCVLWVEGMIYPWKAFRLEQCIQQCNANPRIVGVLVVYNTPGGLLHRVDIASEAIKTSVKPVVGYITGMCASAGIWMASGSKRIFCAAKSDRVGSIGIMTTWEDDSKLYESMGVEFKDLYATLSTKKNEESRAAEEGDFTPIINNLDFANNLFHSQVVANLGIKYDTASPVFQGAMFYAEDAISKGIAHEMGSLNKALKYTLSEGMKVQANNNY